MMAKVAGRGATWGSVLSVDGFVAIRSVGFEPVGQVFGVPTYTDLIAYVRQDARSRLEQTVRGVGADGVVVSAMTDVNISPHLEAIRFLRGQDSGIKGAIQYRRAQITKCRWSTNWARKSVRLSRVRQSAAGQWPTAKCHRVAGERSPPSPLRREGAWRLARYLRSPVAATALPRSVPDGWRETVHTPPELLRSRP